VEAGVPSGTKASSLESAQAAQGKNNRIKTLTRVAYGYRNVKNLRLRILMSNRRSTIAAGPTTPLFDEDREIFKFPSIVIQCIA